LFDFYKEYLESSIIEIFGFGRITDEQIENVFGKYFAKNRVPVIEPSRSVEVGELKEYEENYPVDQAKLSIGFAFNQTVNDVAQRLFLILYGGSPSSLLFANVREKLSLCYYCSAMLEKHKNLMIVYSGVMPEKIEEARKEILAQLANIVRGEFTQFEFSAAKKAYINNLKAMNDSVSQLEDYALNQTLAGKPVSIEDDIMQIEQLTENDIQDVAKTVKPVAVYVLKGGVEQ
jgi:predicted Zn-dependent peptidase